MPAVEDDRAVAGRTRLAAARRTTARELARPGAAMRLVRGGGMRTALAHGVSLDREGPVRRRQDQDIKRVFGAGAAEFGAVDTAQGAPHNPTRPCIRGDARFGGVSRAAKGADCKSAGLRLRRFESYLPHQLENKRENSILAGANPAIFMSRMLQNFPKQFQ